MNSDFCFGVPILGGATWMGGVNYVINLVDSIRRLPENEQPKIALVVEPGYERDIRYYKKLLNRIDILAAVNFEKKPVELPHNTVVYQCYEDLFQDVDFLFPCNTRVVDGPSATWIPDLQHKILPEMFSKQEIEWRDNRFNEITRFGRTLILSSNTAAKHWRSYYPVSRPMVRVLNFYNSVKEETFEKDVIETASRRMLPERYIICCNQFWKHKDHRTLFKALSILKRNGIELPLVCTGETADYRFPKYFEEIKKEIKNLGITDQIYILGRIERSEQLALLRRSMASVQPSQFEGWSTVVEDARSIGKTIFMSNIDVHLEQAPENGYYFEAGNEESLAEILKEKRDKISPGPHIEAEKNAKKNAESLQIKYATKLCEMAMESMYINNRWPPGLNQRLNKILKSRF